MLAEQSILNYLERTAGADPVPGGGSAAALCGALAAALVEMTARLTLDRKGFEPVRAEMEAIAERAARLRSRLAEEIERDADAYRGVLAALRLPKGTPEEHAARRHALQQATLHAAEVPLGVAQAAVELLELGGAVIARGNPNAASDGAAGVFAARAAARAAAGNVRINARALEQASLRDELLAAAARIEARADAGEAEALASWTAGIGGPSGVRASDGKGGWKPPTPT